MRPKLLHPASPFALWSAAASLLLSLSLNLPAAAQKTFAKPAPNRLTTPVNEASLVTLHGTLHGLATAANDRGIAEAAMPLERMQIVLKRTDAQEADLQQLIRDLHTPETASFHQWLTPDQFGQRFGPSDADVATLTAWLAGHGFTVTKLNPGRQTLEFSGTAGQFAQAFHTQIHKYQVNGETHYANASEPAIPAALAPVFGGFTSLNNFRFKSYAKRLGTATYNATTHKSKPDWTVGTKADGYSFLLAPGDFAVQYDLNPLYTANIKGAGQTIAIINEANINLTLVNAYRTLFGLPANPPNVIIDGSDPGIDGINNPDGPNGATIEASLDVEQAGAVAPAATIDLVIAADTALSSGLNLAAEHAVYSNVAPVLSLSFGGCEGAQTAAGNAFISGLWQQAAAQGQTVLVSTGDSGSAGCDNANSQEYAIYGQAVNGLGSTPYNVAVGGTDFYYSSYAGANSALDAQLAQYWGNYAGTGGNPSNASNLTPTTTLQSPIPEQPWNQSQYGLNAYNVLQASTYTQSTIAGGGGGPSNCATGKPETNEYTGGTCAGYPKPSWQTGTGVPADKVRDIPDVALFASDFANYTAYPICAQDGDCVSAPNGETQVTGVGGTSASTPAFAGIMALVNEKTGSRQGQANFVLYPLATQFPTAFHDVAIGNNAVPCAFSPNTPNCIQNGSVSITDPDPNLGTAVEGELGSTSGNTPDYSAGTGYDLASGLGSVDASVLVNNWSNVKFTSSSLTLSPSQTAFTHGTAITISGAVTPAGATGSVALETTSTVPLQASLGGQAGGLPSFALSGGAYTGSVNYLPGGTYNIFGVYSGDGVNASSTSTPVSVTVTAEPSSLLLSALNQLGQSVGVNGATNVPYGTQILLSGLPYPSSCFSTLCNNLTFTNPTGVVTFSDNAATLNAATLNADGDSEYNAGFAIGGHSLTASYAGDSSYSASSATTPIAFTVVKDTPDINTTPLLGLSNSSAQASAASGQTTLTVQVVNSANDTLFNNHTNVYETVVPVQPPTGTVTVTGLPGGTITLPVLQAAVDTSTGNGGNSGLEEGVAAILVPSGISGTYNVNITYSGDSNYNATSTGNFTFQIAPGSGTATTTTAVASQTATSVNAATTVSVTVTGSTAALTGTVYLFAPGAQEIGQTTLPGTSSSATVKFTVNSESLIEGTNVLTAQYLPDQTSTYAPSSALVTIQNGGVSSNPVTSGTISLANSGAITISVPGGSGTSTITATLGNGLTASNVTLSCSVAPTTQNDTPTCSLTGLTPGASTTTATSTLTVSTTAASATLDRPGIKLLPIGGGVVMATLLFFVAPVRRRRWTTLLGAIVLMAAVGFSTGCGGGQVVTPGNPGTTTGTYTVTVSGTASGVTAPASTTVSVTLN